MNSEIPTLKIVIVGDTGVGKTTLLTQYIKRTFTKTNLSTIGSELYKKELEIKGKIIKLEIWDTPGQVRFKTITKNFIQKTNIGIMVCDITKKSSFDHLSEWYETFTNIIDVKDSIIGIAANKSDLFEKEVVHLNEIEDYGNSINCKVFSTTATEYECINDMISELVNDFYTNFIEGKDFKVNNVTKLTEKQTKKKIKCC